MSTILAETRDWIALDKPPGLHSHPLKDPGEATAIALFSEHDPAIARPYSKEKPLEGGLVHRLDQGTSGVLLAARNAGAYQALRELFSNDRQGLAKFYLAWACGASLARPARCTLWLTRDRKHRNRMKAELERPRKIASWEAITSVIPLHLSGDLSLVLLQLHTGAPHQIRATLAAMGAAILNDPTYKPSKRELPAQVIAPLEPETTRLAAALRERLRRIRAPLPQALPHEQGFFLHSLWLRIPARRGVAPGEIFSPPPPWFGL